MLLASRRKSSSVRHPENDERYLGQLLLRLDVAFVQRDRLLAAIQYDAHAFTAGGFAHDDASVNFHPGAAGSAQGRQPYPHARFQFAVVVVAHLSSMRKKHECQQGTPSHREQQDAQTAGASVAARDSACVQSFRAMAA
jgi:hypothetical protein